MLEQVVIGQRGRRDFVARNRELIDEVDRGFVPTGSEPRHTDFVTELIEFLILLGPEFKTTLEVAVGRAKWVFARLGEFVLGVDDVDSSFLKFYSIASSVFGYGN